MVEPGCSAGRRGVYSYSKYHRSSVLPVYGGQPIECQLRALKRGVQIVVGTPGRLLDHIRRGTLKLEQVRTVLVRILDYERPTSAIILCRTKLEVDALGQRLAARAYSVEMLHGDLNQTQRDRVMVRFRSGQMELFIATDVAARGLDIEHVLFQSGYGFLNQGDQIAEHGFVETEFGPGRGE